jgi:sulfatase maturation enzyme AslB (radical SAM superfamily)|tara:strand:+ start:1228 stop:2496 length:1269 start_codon:yes stop_codon:yes gene_type:complete
MEDLKYFCSHLFTSLSFDQRGRVRVCCNNYEIPKDENGKPILVTDEDFSMKKAFASDVHMRIRKNILANKQDPGCIRCWQTEDNGAESYRTIWNNTLASGFYKDIMLESVNSDGYIDDPYVTFLDFTLGNKCNLICRMCNVDNSHIWEKESKLLYPNQELNIPESTVSVNEDFLSDEFFATNLTHLKQVNFLGGEPLIIQEHIDFLKQCIKFDISQNIVLFYTTNLTTVKDELFDLWEEFRHIYLGVSIDGYKEVDDYIRYPSKWAKLEKNIKKVSKWKKDLSMDLQIHATFQALNVLNYDKLLEWVYSLGDLGFWRIPFANWVTYPSWYDCRILPDDLKDIAVERVNKFLDSKKDVKWDVGEEQWLGILKSNLVTLKDELPETEQYDAIARFKIYTKKLDMNRKQHISNYIPELEYFVYES